MRQLLVIAALGVLMCGCTQRAYRSNLAFDVTQRAYVVDRPVEAVAVTYSPARPVQDCSRLVVC